MEVSQATDLLDRLQGAQNAFYAGGGIGELRDILAADVTWTIPGRNAIAGTYRGVDEVLDDFARRRAIADATFRLHRKDVLVGVGDRLAALADGTATISGVLRSWSTVGLYEIRREQVASCWLLALDQEEFDAIWSR